MAERRNTVRWLVAEFVVIVLGVLVALAVDDFRQSREDRRTERQILESIAVDLVSDTSDLTTALASARERVIAAEQLLVATGDPAAGRTDVSSLDVLRKESLVGANLVMEDIGETLGDLSTTFSFTTATAAFGQATATGAIGTIRNPELREVLARYYWETSRSAQQEVRMFRVTDDLKTALRGIGLGPSDSGLVPDARERWTRDQTMLPLVREVRFEALRQIRRSRRLLDLARTTLAAVEASS